MLFYLRISKIFLTFALVIELAKHLEVLLLSNDCVIVPDFGGFVAHYVSAHIDERDGTFIPPIRTLGFNPQLKMNDSLLAQAYMESQDISYPEAIRHIEQEIDEIRRTISREGSFSLEGIGVLRANDEGSYLFEPNESGILSPSLYGLGTFEFLPLSAPSTAIKQEKEKPQAQIVDIETEEVSPSLIEIADTDEEAENAISIKMSWVRNAVAIAAAIILFFMLTTPVANSNMGSQTMSALQNSIIHKLLPKDTNMVPATPVIRQNDIVAKTVAPKDTTQQKSTEKPASQQAAPTNTDKPYCLVLASQVKRSNAEEFVRMLKARGFKDTEIYINNNVVRVVYGHFKSESAAYIELHNLRFEDDFEEAWVYKRKTEG